MTVLWALLAGFATGAAAGYATATLLHAATLRRAVERMNAVSDRPRMRTPDGRSA